MTCGGKYLANERAEHMFTLFKHLFEHKCFQYTDDTLLALLTRYILDFSFTTTSSHASAAAGVTTHTPPLPAASQNPKQQQQQSSSSTNNNNNTTGVNKQHQMFVRNKQRNKQRNEIRLCIELVDKLVPHLTSIECINQLVLSLILITYIYKFNKN